MVMTVLEAHVSSQQWKALREAYETAMAGGLPPQMTQTFLVQSTTDSTLWRGISVWRSREALEEYRRSVATPGGVLVVRSVGAEPSLHVFDVAVSRL